MTITITASIKSATSIMSTTFKQYWLPEKKGFDSLQLRNVPKGSPKLGRLNKGMPSRAFSHCKDLHHGRRPATGSEGRPDVVDPVRFDVSRIQLQI